MNRVTTNGFGEYLPFCDWTKKAETELGDFSLTYNMNGGTSAQMFVTVVPEPSSAVLLAMGVLAFVNVSRRRRR